MLQLFKAWQMQGWAYSLPSQALCGWSDFPDNRKLRFAGPILKRLRPSPPRLEASISVLGLLEMRSSPFLDSRAYRTLMICLADEHKLLPDRKPSSALDRMSESFLHVIRVWSSFQRSRQAHQHHYRQAQASLSSFLCNQQCFPNFTIYLELIWNLEWHVTNCFRHGAVLYITDRL